jgi:hypothetical protein
MRRTITIAVITGAMLAAGSGLAANAATDWQARTCAAFAAWEAHPTAGNLRTLGTDSFNVPWRYLGNDVWGLVSDVRSGSVKYVKSDERYVSQDCAS